MVKLKKLSDNKWEIPKEGNMKVPGIIYASEKLVKKLENDKTFSQIINVASLPGIQRASLAMPDAHQGYQLSAC